MLKILKHSSDGMTGHISADLQVIETDGNSTTTGAVETHGIHPDMLHLHHGGNVKQWIDGIHKAMLERHEARKKSAVAIADLQKLGTIIK